MVWPWKKNEDINKPVDNEKPLDKNKSYLIPREVLISACSPGINGQSGLYSIGRPNGQDGLELHARELKGLSLQAVTVKNPENEEDVLVLLEPSGILYRFVGFINMKESTVTMAGTVVRLLKKDEKGNITDEHGRLVN